MTLQAQTRGFWRDRVRYTCSDLQISKQLYSREDIVGIIVNEAVDSVLRFLPSHMPLDSVERDGEQTNEFLG